LLVDDEWDMLVMISKMLGKIGYEVHAFSSPAKALEHIEEDCQTCEIIMSDIRMPGKSGFELVRDVKVLRPETKVVLMTAFKINKAEAQLVLPSTKVDVFLQKPFNLKELQEAMKEIGRKQQH
jgi:DNA-binding NtrC family response regulator